MFPNTRPEAAGELKHVFQIIEWLSISDDDISSKSRLCENGNRDVSGDDRSSRKMKAMPESGNSKKKIKVSIQQCPNLR
jgi:hypothetical protein